MQFVWLGFLKAGTDANQEVLWQTTEYLQQPYIRIASVGPLRDEAGHRAGMMMIFDVDNRQAAEAFVAGSPFLKAGLYETHHLFEYLNEVG
ncbi:uncharacterized protein YciI [Sphingomonas sp. F9_3S_D5_B_2]